MVATRNPDRTRRRILDAARAEFAAHGPAGGRVDRIAAAAAINKRMIYHYFGGKDALFDAVLLDSFDILRVGQGLEDALQALTEDPDWIRLWVWVGLGVEHRDATAAARWQPIVERIRRELDRSVPADQTPGLGCLALIAVALVPEVLPGLAECVVGEPADTPEFRRQYGVLRREMIGLLVPQPRPEPKPRIRLRLSRP